MKHAMIDIETLGLGVEAPLFQIGVVIFTLGEKPHVIDTRKWDVNLLDVILQTGFVPQEETIKWWRKQDYDPAYPDFQTSSLYNSLHQLSDYLVGHDVEKVWGNSPAFDMVILKQHYEAVGLTVPWTHKQELDFRTVRWLRPNFEYSGEATHNAVDDALAQTYHLIKMVGGIFDV